jgi:60 kDa SS-A/Ro ribonucleoprotein
MKQYSKHLIKRRNTLQSQPIPGLEHRMVKNEAGGYVFAVDDWTRLDRFLIMGSEGNAYYATEKELTIQNLKAIERCVALDGLRTVARIVEISDQGRAVKNRPALLALAYAAKRGDTATRSAANAALPRVCRTQSQLDEWATAIKEFGGFTGASVRKAVAAWYLRDPAQIAYQVIKYRNREGITPGQLVRVSHPIATTEEQALLFDWIVDGSEFDKKNKGERRVRYSKDIWVSTRHKPESLRIIEGFEKLQKASTGSLAAKLIREYNLPREAVPTELLKAPEVAEALLEHMPMTAMIRNLGRMTESGLLAPLNKHAQHVVDVLSDTERLRKARVHPMSILLALKVYAQGHGIKGDGRWTPVPQIIDALNDAFYGSFQFVQPSGKTLLVSIDVSGSMTGPDILGIAGFSPREAAAAFAFVLQKTEPKVYVTAFHDTHVDLPFSKAQRLDDAIRVVERAPSGGTNCAVPILWATAHKFATDAFVIYTDTQTWYGHPHPIQALWDYRKAMGGLKTKLVSAAMVAYTHGDIVSAQDDAGTLGVVGFDSNVPSLVTDFVTH